MNIGHLSCCGLKEMAGISYHVAQGPREALREFLRVNNDRFGFIFSEAVNSARERAYGTELAEFIDANRLGNVTTLPTFVNPNSGNTIRTFFWIPNMTAVRRVVRGQPATITRKRLTKRS